MNANAVWSNIMNVLPYRIPEDASLVLSGELIHENDATAAAQGNMFVGPEKMVL